MDYIIVQAGGRGSRMELLTKNKPKALVPVNNLPMIFHLFKKYPNKKFIVIGDYKIDVLERYLKTFATVDYEIVNASKHKGTCSGLNDALNLIPPNEKFMLIWCDLILPSDYEIPETNKNVIGISKDFSCRWSYSNGKFIEEASNDHGVAGMFIFNDKNLLLQSENNLTGGGCYLKRANLSAGYNPKILNLKNRRFTVQKNMEFTANGANFPKCVAARSIELILKATKSLNTELTNKAKIWQSVKLRGTKTFAN